MKPAPFRYTAPTSLDEALALMTEYGFDAKLLAGGQSLIPVMNFRLAQPAVIVDINGVAELSYEKATDDGLRLGAMVRQTALEQSPTVAELAPLIHHTMPYVAHSQIRNRGTLGGSLAHADPAAELPVVMVALQARFRLQRQAGDRWIDAADFYQSLFTTALAPEEILTDILIPPVRNYSGFALEELARRHGDYAQAGVAAAVTLSEDGRFEQVRLVFLNVGEIPLVAKEATAALSGQTPTPDLLAQVAQAAAQNEIDPSGDIHASAEYKRHLAQVLARRALQTALSRAQANLPTE